MTESFDLWEDTLERHLTGFKAIVELVTFKVTVSDLEESISVTTLYFP
jgi:hypothetical protein